MSTLTIQPEGIAAGESSQPGLLRRAGAAYLDWRLRRATVRILQSLDKRALTDIGMSHSEIHSVVYGDPRDRAQHLRPTWE